MRQSSLDFSVTTICQLLNPFRIINCSIFININRRLDAATRSKKKESTLVDSLILVGVTGFEPATSASRTLRATKLRHTPLVNRGNYIIIYMMPRKNSFFAMKNYYSLNCSIICCIAGTYLFGLAFRSCFILLISTHSSSATSSSCITNESNSRSRVTKYHWQK